MPEADRFAADKPGSRRKERLASLLRREIAAILNQELRDPRLGFITVTRVTLTADLSEVTAHYTLLDPSRRKLAASALKSATPYIQRGYAKTVRTRRLPLLRWRYDEGEERRHEMDVLIRQARASDPDGGEDLAPDAPAQEH